MLLPGFKPVVIVKNPGTDNESRMAAQGAIQPEMGYFAPETQIYEGDEVEIPDPRGGSTRLRVAQVHIIYGAGTGLNHLEVVWGEPSIQHTAPIRRLGLDGLHPEILKISSNLFTDKHYADAVFNAFKAVEVRVREMSGLKGTGESLMGNAFNGDVPKINLAVEPGQSDVDEQRGFKFLFMGAMAGIRNPKAHGFVGQQDPQRTLEYLAFASLLMRRLDDSSARAATV